MPIQYSDFITTQCVDVLKPHFYPINLCNHLLYINVKNMYKRKQAQIIRLFEEKPRTWCLHNSLI